MDKFMLSSTAGTAFLFLAQDLGSRKGQAGRGKTNR